ncbi:MAG: TetR/AcrR family transcriptional regulator [Lewinellaceae bacterium]|nr:TetR/AcrR family transcriptional regulator [Saprospiraceae bacterium]MCB9332951.1 TetR/AcrR family transcriptional regulator [Lewinellaceae bacterium]
MPVQKIEKEDFLMRCWEEFHLNGYYNTSMQKLAAATGLQKAGLYHHYPTKEDLMRRVMEFALDQFRSYVLAVSTELDLPPEQRLEKLLRRHKKLAILHRRGCFFANIALETGREGLFNEVLKTGMMDWADAVSKILSEYMPAGAAQSEALRLIMEYEGAVLFYKLTAEEEHLEAFIHRAVTNLKRASEHSISLKQV